jgi:hypothetical protein
LVPAKNGSIPEAPDGGHSSQAGTVLLDAAAGVEVDDDVPVLVVDVVVAGVDDDAPALVGAVNVVIAAVEVEVVVAVIAGKLATPPVVTLEPAMPAVEAVVPAVCAAAGPASAIRNGSAMRNSWVMALSHSIPHELL